MFGGTLHDCTVRNNSGHYGGGVLESTLYNCTVTGNSASYGGGVSESTLYNCTIATNGASYGGGGFISDLYNCIVYGNSSPIGVNYYGGNLLSSCTSPLPSGEGNIDADPLFVNAAIGDFRLKPGSPCIDTGSDLTALIAADLLGVPRPLDGDGDRVAKFDMGAYEFNPYRFEPALQVTADGFQFKVRGEPGKSVRIERSSDLVNWEFAGQIPIPASGQTLIDPVATSESFLFYRAVKAP